jgi:hypothetical protein
VNTIKRRALFLASVVVVVAGCSALQQVGASPNDTDVLTETSRPPPTVTTPVSTSTPTVAPPAPSPTAVSVPAPSDPGVVIVPGPVIYAVQQRIVDLSPSCVVERFGEFGTEDWESIIDELNQDVTAVAGTGLTADRRAYVGELEGALEAWDGVQIYTSATQSSPWLIKVADHELPVIGIADGSWVAIALRRMELADGRVAWLQFGDFIGSSSSCSADS